MAFREEVRAMIESASLVITEYKTLVMNERGLEIIYSDLPKKYRRVVFQPFKNASVEMALVAGENATDTLLKIAGTELDPIDCTPESIRFKLGGREPFVIDGVRWYVNIIHRPRNKVESERGVELFRTL